jgi:LacI family transcriptional regulator
VSARVNLRELARNLGLSESTVSKALNDRPDVSGEVKARVLEAARELGYVADRTARRLALGRSGMLGVFLVNRFGRQAGEYFGFNFLGGIMKEAQERGYDLLVFQESEELEEVGYFEYARRRGVEGAILIGLWPDDPRLWLDMADAIPWVSIDTPVPGAPGRLVATDNWQGVRTMLDEVYRRGHRRVGYIGIHGGGYVGTERRASFEAFCAGREIFSPELCVDTALNVESGRAAARSLLSRDDRPSAIVCASDLQALGALRATRELGLAVPGDVAITGFDNLPAAALSAPALTTMRQDTDGIGRAAIRSLFALRDRAKDSPAENPGVAQPVLVPASLVLRETL